MNGRHPLHRATVGTAAAAIALGTALVSAAPATAAQPAAYSSGTYRPTSQVLLSVGEGQMINLPRGVANVWTSNPKVADVFVNSPRQLNLFGKEPGEATVIATAADGSVVYGANVRVNQNISSINQVLQEAMPGLDIRVTTVGQVAVINGTVSSPEEASLAQSIVRAALNPGTKEGDPVLIMPINRLRTATPLQVMLKVRIAEINRSMLKSVGVNLLNRDTASSTGNLFGIGQGKPGTVNVVEGTANPVTGVKPSTVTGATFNNLTGATTLGFFGRIFGTDLLATVDLMQNDGFITTLAEPTLTALSGETASFLAGGEFPIPVSQSLGSLSIEYKQYGVGLAFTPIVLADGRISMRVRPEVSELSDAGAVKLNGYTIPALTTRRAETTVELGSGQSFMLAGLLQNRNNNNIQKAPFLGDLPILGALFRSTSFQRSETELVIIVTPYLVRPVSGQLASPADGYRAPSDPELYLEGKLFNGVSGPRPSGPVTGPASGASTGTTAAAAGSRPLAAPGFKL